MKALLWIMSVVVVVSGCTGSQLAPVVDSGVEGSDVNAALGATKDASGTNTEDSQPQESHSVTITTIDETGNEIVVTQIEDEEPQAVALSAPEDMRDEPVNPAVVALLNRANAEGRAGNFDKAAASLERALKIEPQDAWLWHRLAQTRLQQGQLEQSQTLAVRSNSLAGGDRQLLADNWMLIAEARRRDGDVSGAKAATLKAEQLSKG